MARITDVNASLWIAGLLLTGCATARQPVVNTVRTLAADARSIVTAPARWDAHAWRRAAATTAGIGLLVAADDVLQPAVQRNRTPATDEFSEVITPFGGRRAVNIAAALALTGAVTRNERLRRTGTDAIEASFLAGFTVTPAIKSVVGRSRPVAGEGAYAFDPFSRNRSFPSGHATNAFAVASVIAAHSNGWIVPTIAWTVATGVAVSRVNDNVHFVSDVVAGSLIGAGIGRAVVRLHARSPERRVLFVPRIDERRRVVLTIHVRLP